MEMMKKCVEATKVEKGCLYYGWTINGDKLKCREAYIDGDAVAVHLAAAGPIIGPCLEAGVLKMDKIDMDCGAEELKKFKKGGDGFGAKYFMVDSGFTNMPKHSQGRSDEKLYESLCTIHPTFTILKKEECMEMMKKCVEATKVEKGCLYYGWTINGDKLKCREAYIDGDAVAVHLAAAGPIIGPCLEAGVLKMDKIDMDCGAEELKKFKKGGDGFGAKYFMVDSGFSNLP